jgi:hypothetical protein
LRRNGWDLRTLDQAKLVRGELIRVESHRSVIDLYRDGTLILWGQIDRNFLAWSDRTDLGLHPLAFIEVVVNFTRFYSLILSDFRVVPQRVNFRIEFRNLHLNNEKVRLRSGPVRERSWEYFGEIEMEAPSDFWSREIAVSTEGYDSDSVAFSLVREAYLWFGHSDEAIPYAKPAGTGWLIDVAQIAKNG